MTTTKIAQSFDGELGRLKTMEEKKITIGECELRDVVVTKYKHQVTIIQKTKDRVLVRDKETKKPYSCPASMRVTFISHGNSRDFMKKYLDKNEEGKDGKEDQKA